MATLVNREGWCVYNRQVWPCVVAAQDLQAATVDVIINDYKRVTVDAYQFTTQQETADEWTTDLCRRCNGTGKVDAYGEMIPCPLCKAVQP